MKTKLFVAAATVALAACGSNEEPAPEPLDTATPADTTLGSTATGDMTGTYEVQMADGSVTMQQINADGTYVDTMPDGTETERGTWRQDGSQMCFDPEGTGPEECYAGGAPGSDGSFQMRDADGNTTATVRKVDGNGVAAETTM